MKNRWGKVQKRLAQSVGVDEATFEAPFKMARQQGLLLLHGWLVALTEDERKYAIWFIERNAEAEKLQRKVMGTFLGNVTKSIITILWWHFKNALGIKQRNVDERDLNRPWNEKRHDYDNDWYRYLDETDRLKVMRFGQLAPESMAHVEEVIDAFTRDAFFNWGRAVEFGEKISKNYVEERIGLLKKWLANPEGEPPTP